MKNFIPTLIPVILLLSCVQRDDGVGNRSNPYDPGGDSWSINAPPEVTAILDTGWVDFDHVDSSGSLILHIASSDRNIPFDTLEFTVTVNLDTIKIFDITTRDTSVLISKLVSDARYRCSVVAVDLRSAADTHTISFTTPALPPPPRPKPYLLPGASAVSIYWPVVSGADEYHVYSSVSDTGPYRLLQRVEQQVSGTVTVTDTPADYNPVYYLVASANGSGEAFASDTLLGCLFYTGLSTPSLN